MLEITIKRKGNLLARVLHREITQEQADAIRLIVESPENYVVVPVGEATHRIGFAHREVGNAR